MAKYDISKLSREEKLQLLQLLEEKKKRDLVKRPNFKDRAHQGQLDVLKSRSIERFVFSGNGAGKTALGCEDLRCAVTGTNPYTGERTPLPCRAFVVLDKPEKVETVLLPELMKWMHLRPDQLHKKGKPYISLVTLDNGSTIRFIFWDQEPMTAEGLEGDYFLFDEPCPRPLYVALKRAGRTKGRQARYLFIGTPLAAPWMRTEVYDKWVKGERPDTECFRFHTESNRQNLADGYIEQFSAVLSEREKAIRLGGAFFDLDGLALAHLFKRETHTVPRRELEWDKENPCVVIIDPHPSKSHVSTLLGADRDNRIVVLEEFSAKQVARQYTKSLIELGWFHNYTVVDIVYDSLGSTDGTGGEGFKSFGQVMSEVLREHGIGRARATSYAEKDDEEWLSRIQDALLVPEKPDNFGRREPKLKVVADLKGVIGDFENVQWARDKRLDQNKPKLDITNKDFLACVKYGLATNIYFTKRKDKAYYVSRPAYGFNLKPRR